MNRASEENQIDDYAWRASIAAYPADCQPFAAPARATSGRSGAAVFKLETPRGSLALRRWDDAASVKRVAAIHAILGIGRSAGLDALPQPIPARQGGTAVWSNNAVWDLCDWRPGAALSRDAVGEEAVRAGVELIARWHAAMSPAALGVLPYDLAQSPIARAFLEGSPAPSPGLARRRHEWRRLRARIEQSSPYGKGDWSERIERTRRLVKATSATIDALLKIDPEVRLRLCLRDAHREHLLFDGGRLTGLVDFGAIGFDTPAVDLARWIADADPPSGARRPRGPLLAAFRRWAPLADVEEGLLPALELSSAAVAALHWWEWLVADPKPGLDMARGVSRWDECLDRWEVFAGIHGR